MTGLWYGYHYSCKSEIYVKVMFVESRFSSTVYNEFAFRRLELRRGRLGFRKVQVLLVDGLDSSNLLIPLIKYGEMVEALIPGQSDTIWPIDFDSLLRHTIYLPSNQDERF